MMMMGGLSNEQMAKELEYSGITMTFVQKGAETYLRFELNDRDGFVLDNNITVGKNTISFTSGNAAFLVTPNTSVQLYTSRQVGGGRYFGKVKLDGDTAEWSVNWEK